MKTVEEISQNKRVLVGDKSSDGFCGEIHLGLWKGSFICSTGAGWEHVSVHPYKMNCVPSWDDMCKVKDIFWNDDEEVIQIHPAKNKYVNNVPNCLHLWRCTYREMVLPPSCLVGLREGQTAEELMEEVKEAYERAGEKY